jgi:hypothetical protein
LPSGEKATVEMVDAEVVSVLDVPLDKFQRFKTPE